jgi:hypothetical protein
LTIPADSRLKKISLPFNQAGIRIRSLVIFGTQQIDGGRRLMVERQQRKPELEPEPERLIGRSCDHQVGA